jgi:hypothetical protein
MRVGSLNTSLSSSHLKPEQLDFLSILGTVLMALRQKAHIFTRKAGTTTLRSRKAVQA